MTDINSLGHLCACGNWLGGEVNPAYVVNSQWGVVRIQRCPSCGLAQSTQFPSVEEQLTLYGGNEIYQPPQEEQFQAAKGAAVHVVHDLERLSVTSGRVLEVGCYVGYAMALFREHGFDVTGVEKNVACAEHARSKYGLRVFNDLSEIPVDERFRIIFISHLLEHITDVNQFIRAVRGFSEKDSILYVKVPNYASLFARYILRSRWHAFIPKQHVWYFEKSTLTSVLHQHGYIPVCVYTREFASNGASRRPLKRLAREVLGTIERAFDCGQEIVGIFRLAGTQP